MSLGFVIIVLDLIGLLTANPGWPWLGALNEDGFVQSGQLTVWRWCWHIMSAWGLATTALLLCYRVASPSHTHKKCFSFSPSGRKVAFKLSQGRRYGCIWRLKRSALVSDSVWMASEQILSWWNFMLLPRRVCVSVLDVIETPLQISNMFLQEYYLDKAKLIQLKFLSAPRKGRKDEWWCKSLCSWICNTFGLLKIACHKMT